MINLIPHDHLDIVGRIQGYKIEHFHQLITSNNLKNCVEIGVWKGSSLFAIANGVKQINGTVTGIDPWAMESLPNDIPGNPNLLHHILNNIIGEQATLEKVYNQLLTIIETNNLQDIIKIIRKKSEDAYTYFEDNSIDLLHIDGNHDEHQVTKDIINYFNKVKPNGFFVLDDINWPGVNNAFQKHLKDKVKTIHNDSTWSTFQKL